jgi:hypothetical protein
MRGPAALEGRLRADPGRVEFSPKFGAVVTGAGHDLDVFEFEYRLIGSGWSEARVADTERHATVTASYLSDALKNLVEAVALVVEGAPEARCSWDEEPGEYRWIFTRVGNAVDLRVLSFREMWSDEPDQ